MTMPTIPSAAQTNSADLLREPGAARGPRKTPSYRAAPGAGAGGDGVGHRAGLPEPGATKPLGDAFIRAISIILTLIIFCTVVTGIVGMESLKKIGRIGETLRQRFAMPDSVAFLTEVGGASPAWISPYRLRERTAVHIGEYESLDQAKRRLHRSDKYEKAGVRDFVDGTGYCSGACDHGNCCGR